MNCEVKLTNNNNNKNFLLSSPVTVYSYGCYGSFLFCSNWNISLADMKYVK